MVRGPITSWQINWDAIETVIPPISSAHLFSSFPPFPQKIHKPANIFSLFDVYCNCSHEAKAPILWPPDAKSRLIGKDPDAGKERRQEEMGTTENEMVGWHHRLDGHEFQ